MCIKTAIQLAMRENKCIKRNDPLWERIVIKPTASSIWCCVAIGLPPKEPRPQWSPTAEDLTADDWEVVDGFRPDWEPNDEELTEEYLGIKNSDQAFA